MIGSSKRTTLPRPIPLVLAVIVPPCASHLSAPGAIGLRYYTVILPDEKALNATIDQMRIAEAIVEERETGFFTRDPSQNGVLLTTQDK